jgi:hypothetical protein
MSVEEQNEEMLKPLNEKANKSKSSKGGRKPSPFDNLRMSVKNHPVAKLRAKLDAVRSL